MMANYSTIKVLNYNFKVREIKKKSPNLKFANEKHDLITVKIY